MKKRHKRIVINIVAFSALAFAIYFSFFHKDEPFEPASRTASPRTAQVAK